MKIFKKKQQEIEHLKKVRAEQRDDAAWFYMQGNYAACIECTMMAAGTNRKLIQRRRRAF